MKIICKSMQHNMGFKICLCGFWSLIQFQDAEGQFTQYWNVGNI